MNRRLKKSVVYVLYGLAFLFMLTGLFYIDSTSDSKEGMTDQEYRYVSQDVMEDDKDIPVNAIEENGITIIRPYTSDSVKILKNYYSLSDDESTQENSLIYYNDTYMPSSGVSYGEDNIFDVVSILDGEVIEVKEDDILGNVITIKHDNGIMSSYQSVSEIVVKNGDKVKQGNIIAKSGTSNISTDLGNHLYFELIINGVNVDPEDYYDKNIDEI